MTYQVGEPESDDCTFCRSKQTSIRRTVDDGKVTIVRHCNMCRRDVELWSGTRVEERKRNAMIKANKLKMDAAARQLPGGGATSP